MLCLYLLLQQLCNAFIVLSAALRVSGMLTLYVACRQRRVGTRAW